MLALNWALLQQRSLWDHANDSTGFFYAKIGLLGLRGEKIFAPGGVLFWHDAYDISEYRVIGVCMVSVCGVKKDLGRIFYAYTGDCGVKKEYGEAVDFI